MHVMKTPDLKKKKINGRTTTIQMEEPVFFTNSIMINKNNTHIIIFTGNNILVIN